MEIAIPGNNLMGHGYCEELFGPEKDRGSSQAKETQGENLPTSGHLLSFPGDLVSSDWKPLSPHLNGSQLNCYCQPQRLHQIKPQDQARPHSVKPSQCRPCSGHRVLSDQRSVLASLDLSFQEELLKLRGAGQGFQE
ncbi:hypothetical protein STEG23_003536, partial [Scotinomys teguina]